MRTAACHPAKADQFLRCAHAPPPAAEASRAPLRRRLRPGITPSEKSSSEHGSADIDLALQTAFDSIKYEPNASKRIVLLTAGHGFVDAASIAEFDRAKIPVDTIAFDPWSDYALLDKFAQTTGGDFAAAN